MAHVLLRRARRGEARLSDAQRLLADLGLRKVSAAEQAERVPGLLERPERDGEPRRHFGRRRSIDSTSSATLTRRGRGRISLRLPFSTSRLTFGTSAAGMFLYLRLPLGPRLWNFQCGFAFLRVPSLTG